ncbi:hypothetical protein VP01_3701g1 [Puccinia sorghi]|uniref:Uncharacterized protein n=1 Tax=Puccinia sorghi TaxID=27349 RepID=A0A0L6UUY5_9BASI|nr:hypothetical protein VP01_3701g1 [Puccinia sorghi]
MHICTCEDSGCAHKFYHDNNSVERMGVPLSNSAYRNHQRLSRLNEFLLSSTNNASVPTPPTQVIHQHSIQAPGEMTISSDQE